MKKYKYSRKEWAMEFSKWLGFDDKYADFDQDAKDERKWLRDLLATKPESDKERCECYVEDSDSEDKCKKCGMPFGEHELKPDSVILVNDVKKFNCRSTKPQEELEVEEIDIMELHGKDLHFALKQNELIKAHNALVKEVRK